MGLEYSELYNIISRLDVAKLKNAKKYIKRSLYDWKRLPKKDIDLREGRCPF